MVQTNCWLGYPATLDDRSRTNRTPLRPPSPARTRSQPPCPRAVHALPALGNDIRSKRSSGLWPTSRVDGFLVSSTARRSPPGAGCFGKIQSVESEATDDTNARRDQTCPAIHVGASGFGAQGAVVSFGRSLGRGLLHRVSAGGAIGKRIKYAPQCRAPLQATRRPRSLARPPLPVFSARGADSGCRNSQLRPGGDLRRCNPPPPKTAALCGSGRQWRRASPSPSGFATHQTGLRHRSEAPPGSLPAWRYSFSPKPTAPPRTPRTGQNRSPSHSLHSRLPIPPCRSPPVAAPS